MKSRLFAVVKDISKHAPRFRVVSVCKCHSIGKKFLYWLILFFPSWNVISFLVKTVLFSILESARLHWLPILGQAVRLLIHSLDVHWLTLPTDAMVERVVIQLCITGHVEVDFCSVSKSSPPRPA